MAKRVLVVDDSEIIRQQVSIALEKAGFEVEEAVDGLDALEKLAAPPAKDLVITDMNMPRMDGLKLLKKIKSEESLLRIPVLILTTEGDAELIADAKRSGASGWVVKSFSSDKLVAAAKKLTSI